MTVRTPHDRLFLFSFEDLEVARGELEATLPEHLKLDLDLDLLQIEKTRFVEEDLSARFCDILYRAPLRRGGEAFVWVLLEHQSKSDPLMAFRLLEYIVRAWSKLLHAQDPTPDKLPIIVPVVLQHDPNGWRAARTLAGLYDAPRDLVDDLLRNIPDFEYILDDITAYTDEQLAARADSPFLQLVLWSLRSRGEVDEQQKPAWIHAFRALWRAGKYRAALAIVRYHVEVSEADTPVALQAAVEADPELERSCMTLYERLKMEGEERGVIKGEASTLLKLIKLKFGPPPEEIVARVESADQKQLDRWVERILTASSLEEFFGA